MYAINVVVAYSNTTLVKVKLTESQLTKLEQNYSNTTLVKVKCNIVKELKDMGKTFKYNTC